MIDIFLAESDELAIRVELFDEIENICTFDPLTGAIDDVCRGDDHPKTCGLTGHDARGRRFDRG